MISKKHRISKAFFSKPPTGRIVHGRFITIRIYSMGDAATHQAEVVNGTVWKAAVVVSKKINPSAVCRNRIKRQMYEIVRRFVKVHAPIKPITFVLYPKKGLDQGSVAEITSDVVSVLKTATLAK